MWNLIFLQKRGKNYNSINYKTKQHEKAFGGNSLFLILQIYLKKITSVYNLKHEDIEVRRGS